MKRRVGYARFELKVWIFEPAARLMPNAEELVRSASGVTASPALSCSRPKYAHTCDAVKDRCSIICARASLASFIAAVASMG